MLGLLPKTLNVGGIDYKIRTDYRDIFRVISAFNDPDLTDREKVYVCLAKVYVDFETLPKNDYEAAYEAAISFIECRIQEDKPGPRIINWEKDELLLFPAINKVAGFEVRAVPYLHWWTFLGYFNEIDKECVFGAVLIIRQKRARHKKLEKYEQDFYNANRDLCDVEKRKTREDVHNDLQSIYNELLKGGAE